MDEELSAQSHIARLTFIGLWTLADREGRLEDRPRRIHAALFPYEPEAPVTAALDALVHAGFVHRYTVGGRPYLEVKSFLRHQRPNLREPQSVIPPRTDTHVQKRAEQIMSDCSADQTRCSAALEGKGREGKGEGISARAIPVAPSTESNMDGKLPPETTAVLSRTESSAGPANAPQNANGEVTGPSGEKPVTGQKPPDIRNGFSWCHAYGQMWAKHYQAHYGNGGDARACGRLSDMLATMPALELAHLWDMRIELFASFLREKSDEVIKARHPFAFLVTRWTEHRPDVKVRVSKPTTKYLEIPPRSRNLCTPEQQREVEQMEAQMRANLNARRQRQQQASAK